MKNKVNYIMRYRQPAENSAKGWEEQSLPIGNGYLGANIFGIVAEERIQITENSLQNPKEMGGLNNFAELTLSFPHKAYENYERGLNLNQAKAYCTYSSDRVRYTRNYFACYPYKILAVSLEASEKGKVSFELKFEAPFVRDYANELGDGGGKTAQTIYREDMAILSGKMNYYEILFEGRVKVIAQGAPVLHTENGLKVEGADSAVIFCAVGTNYELSPKVFLEQDPKKKLDANSPADKVEHILQTAVEAGYEAVWQAHLDDYQSLFGRVDLELAKPTDKPVDQMLQEYREGTENPYLEMLHFQYGRYLLISSSRKGTLPANLQGVWNCHDKSPWGSGYWHNINVQMNYWPAFVTNLRETFESYVDFNKAFREKAQQLASEYIQIRNPENYDASEGGCGWTIGTASYPYTISSPGGHSGPGTGGLTSKLFWDYYEFTKDEDILKNVTYPALCGMSKFLTKTVKEYEGEYLVSFSASPEQMLNREYIRGGKYYQTIGCAFDQQMLYENGHDFLKAAELLGKTDEIYAVQKQQIDHYHPVEIGWSGQVKEYMEENLYGEIGEYNHRHISQLVGLHPGTLITKQTPAWMDAAKYTLNERSDQSTGWALAHRINAWARTGDGDRAYKLYRTLLGERTVDNLWDMHPPFQIDGNFGATAGIAEMLLQSHEGFIELLPALPKAWPNGSFSGLVARGNFEVSAQWENGVLRTVQILSNKGETCRLSYDQIAQAKVSAQDIAPTVKQVAQNMIEFETNAGEIYTITGFCPQQKSCTPGSITVHKSLLVEWTPVENAVYNLYYAPDSQPGYTLAAQGLTECSYRHTQIDFDAYQQIRYKVTAVQPGKTESEGICATVNHASDLYIERYKNIIEKIKFDM